MSFLVPEASSLPRFRKPKDDEPEPTVRRSISPPRSRSSSVTSTGSAKQSKMSNLLNKVKAKMADHPNAVSEDHPEKPTSGVQDVPEGSHRNKYGQGGYNEAEQEIRFGSITDENAASHTFRGTVHTASGGDGVGGPQDAQKAVQNVEQNTGKEGSTLK